MKSNHLLSFLCATCLHCNVSHVEIDLVSKINGRPTECPPAEIRVGSAVVPRHSSPTLQPYNHKKRIAHANIPVLQLRQTKRKADRPTTRGVRRG